MDITDIRIRRIDDEGKLKGSIEMRMHPIAREF